MGRGPVRLAGLQAAAFGLALLLPAGSGTGSGAGAAALGVATSSVAYADGVVADELRPVAVDPGAPVVVLVHGCCGDRRDMAGVARALARRGAVVLNIDVRRVADGGGWPASYDEVGCAVRTAGRLAARLGGGSHAVALVGWSEGALLAATVTLGWRELGTTTACPGSRAAPGAPAGEGPDILVGMGGYYGWDGPDVPADLVTDQTVAWFGATPDADPEAWQQGNPRWWLAHPAIGGTIPPVRLIAAPDDPHASSFRDALAAQGADTAVATIAGATHLALIQPRDLAGAAALSALCESLGLPARQ
jgi:acetyl esterase/lipase